MINQWGLGLGYTHWAGQAPRETGQAWSRHFIYALTRDSRPGAQLCGPILWLYWPMLAYVGLSCGQCGPMLWLCWPHVDSCWAKRSEKWEQQRNTVKRRVFWWSAAYLGAMLAHLGAMLAYLEGNVGRLGYQLEYPAFCSPSSLYWKITNSFFVAPLFLCIHLVCWIMAFSWPLSGASIVTSCAGGGAWVAHLVEGLHPFLLLVGVGPCGCWRGAGFGSRLWCLWCWRRVSHSLGCREVLARAAILD